MGGGGGGWVAEGRLKQPFVLKQQSVFDMKHRVGQDCH